jgi:hypothetical protein
MTGIVLSVNFFTWDAEVGNRESSKPGRCRMNNKESNAAVEISYDVDQRIISAASSLGNGNHKLVVVSSSEFISSDSFFSSVSGAGGRRPRDKDGESLTKQMQKTKQKQNKNKKAKQKTKQKTKNKIKPNRGCSERANRVRE